MSGATVVSAFLWGSFSLAAMFASVGLLFVALYGSIEWSVNGLPRRRDRVAVVALVVAVFIAVATTPLASCDEAPDP